MKIYPLTDIQKEYLKKVLLIGRNYYVMQKIERILNRGSYSESEKQWINDRVKNYYILKNKNK